MTYKIRQITTYRYATPVPFARHVMRLMPAAGHGLEIHASRLELDPQPDEMMTMRDYFGNAVTHVALEKPHGVLEILSEAIVSTQAGQSADPEKTPAWEMIRAVVATSADLSARAPVHHLFPSPFVPLDAAIRDYAAQSFPPGRPVLAGGLDLMQRIKADFVYDPEATEVTTPVAEAFALRRGVCQDFAHVMISGLRGLGLPAAYISGYLRTVPLPGRPRLEGADAMHAWVALWCGESAGWQGLDPTNAVRAEGDHIPLAFGRDYADVSPVDGVIIAAGGHSLSVSVDVVEVE